ncbi:SDR family NAD(P)-dependent oxidoreductase [Devosia nitrariae]|uniref:Short-chain dehydrogenase n=1 Tax=Devosia nitrariae TaxID=2071872 RepID=A0ABQ5W8R2_9HYPH|nr:SDR family NAD(P)-dependent oxidoreductase [Devosia nitrariae]GLQ56428.1 short-chain dehydrogenase [Devosia nitrariae]
MSSTAEAAWWPAGSFAGKRVLVTGGTSGIGAAVARAFLQAGAEVTATGIAEGEIAALQADPVFAAAELALLDVRDKQAVDALVGELAGLDVLVNCAGIIRRGAELDPEVFDQVIDVNLSGTMRMCVAARPLLAASGSGAIVNTASMLSIFGGGLVPGYAASKGGISQLTKSLAIAYAPERIRVNAVAPGWIATPLTQALRDDASRSDAILARTPLNRWGTPDDVANAVLYLCSPLAAFVVGTTLVVDGGYSVT